MLLLTAGVANYQNIHNSQLKKSVQADHSFTQALPRKDLCWRYSWRVLFGSTEKKCFNDVKFPPGKFWSEARLPHVNIVSRWFNMWQSGFRPEFPTRRELSVTTFVQNLQNYYICQKKKFWNFLAFAFEHLLKSRGNYLWQKREPRMEPWTRDEK